jgi:hypothetical protein
MRNQFNENDELMGDLEDLLTCETTAKVKAEIKANEVEEEEHVLVPLDYLIFSTSNNEPTGKREIIDTYKCDRIKGIVPSGKARMKADLMKKAFPNKRFFVEETASKIFDNGRLRTVSKIYYQTK